MCRKSCETINVQQQEEIKYFFIGIRFIPFYMSSNFVSILFSLELPDFPHSLSARFVSVCSDSRLCVLLYVAKESFAYVAAATISGNFNKLHISLKSLFKKADIDLF